MKEGGQFEFNRIPFVSGDRTAFVDDLTTVGGTKERLKTAVARAGGIPLPHLLLLFNRSGLTEVCGLKITALVDKKLPLWTPEECPLCMIGSKAIRVKGSNWQLFTASY